MSIKRLSVLLIAVLLLTSISACDFNKEKKPEEANNKGNSTLKIYYTNYDKDIPYALNKFKEKYKDITIEDSYFRDTDEFKNKITVDILSGEGPDVFLLRPILFESVNKMMSRGVLCDLNELISKDKDFRMADYNEKVMNAFEQNGKRFVIPLRYATGAFIASKAAIQRNRIIIDPSNWTYKELVKIAEKYMSDNRGSKKYFLYNFGIKDMVKGSGISFVDYNNKKSRFNSAGFIEMLEIYKRLYPSIYLNRNEKESHIDDMIKNDAFIMMPDLYVSPYNLFLSHSLYKSIGEEMEFYPFPALNGGSDSSFSYAEEAIAVNSRCRNKEAAFNLVKVILSEDYQALKYKTGSSNKITVPVNKKAYESDCEYFTVGYEEKPGTSISMKIGDYSFSTVPLPKGYKPVLDNILSKVDRCQIPEEEIFKIINEGMPDFLEGKRTAAQTAKVIDDKVNLYLNE